MRELVTIHNDTNHILRRKCAPVDKVDDSILSLIKDMEEYAGSHPLCAGLSAPQLGIHVRVSLINQPSLHLVMINPEIVKAKGSYRVREGCLSFPGMFYILTRPKIVKVHYTDVNGILHSVKGRDLTAQILCHEIDHLDGLLIDRGVYVRTI